MLVTPTLFLHYSYTAFLHLLENIIFDKIEIFRKEKWIFFRIVIIYDYQNFGKGNEHGISRGCKNSRTYLLTTKNNCIF